MNALIRKLCAAATLSIAVATQAQSTSPTGPVILTVIDSQGAEIALDLEMIEGLDQIVTVTETPWYDGAQEFSGPLISDLMAHLDLSGNELSFIAVNDYAASMPWSDIETYQVILATRHGGKEMSVRDKGPLFVIYPFDAHPELRNEVIFSRSVWQVKAVKVNP